LQTRSKALGQILQVTVVLYQELGLLQHSSCESPRLPASDHLTVESLLGTDGSPCGDIPDLIIVKRPASIDA